MKAIIFFSALLLVFSCNHSNPESEIEAIKQVIEKETNAFHKVDKAGWEASWTQTPYAYWSYSDSTGTSFIEGWEDINDNFNEYFTTQVPNRNIDVAHPDDELVIERDYKEFRVYSNGAFVQYTQRVKDQLIKRDATSQIRVLEKQNGKWLITYVGIIARYPSVN